MSDTGIPLLHARRVATDPRNGLGDLYQHDWDYVIHPRTASQRKIAEGWTHVADIETSASGEDMIMLGRPKSARPAQEPT